MKEHGTKKEDGTTKGDGKGVIIAIITTLGTIIVALITSWGSHSNNSVPATPTPTPISTPSPAMPKSTPSTVTPISLSNPIKRAKYLNVNGAWAVGQDPDKTHYTLVQTGASIMSSGDFGDGQGNFQGPKRFIMNWKIGSFTAEIFDDHLDWSNGSYWVRPGTSLAPDPGNLSGRWEVVAFPQAPLLTLTQFPDGRVTSVGPELGEGHLLPDGRLTMKWPSQSTTFKAVMRGNRLYWDNGGYWKRFGN